jgi:hypothetical protein
LRYGIEPIIGKILVPKQGTAMAMEATGADLLAGGIIIGAEELIPALLFLGEFAFADIGAVKL